MGVSNDHNDKENQKIYLRINNIESRIRNLEKLHEIIPIEHQIPYNINLILQNFESRIQSLERISNIKNKDKVNNISKDNKYNKYQSIKKKNFFRTIDKNIIKTQYYEPYEIIKQNEMIINYLKDNVYKYYMKEDLNETAGEFLYEVGKISRISVSISNDIYKDFFNEYQIFLNNNKEFLTYNHEQDRRNLSIWIKNVLEEKECFEYYSFLYEKKIIGYIDKKDKNTQDILIILFKYLINLYTKCMLSFPFVYIKYIDPECNFNSEIMFDIILKYGRTRKVNFCFLPGLISNGKNISNGYYYVFTYTGKTYKKRGNLYENEKPIQKNLLYSLPDYEKLTIGSSSIIKINDQFYKIIIEEKPKISPELWPRFYLYDNNEVISEDQNRSLIIDKKYLGHSLTLLIIDRTGKNKSFNIDF